MSSINPLDEKCVNTIRILSADAIQKANSGHPGLPMGCAAIGYTLWTRHLRHNPSNPSWMNRDRFVLSAGHGSMLLYSLLHLTGYDLPLSEIQNFRQWDSKTPGHPEVKHTPGVETTTGPLGQGIANAVGLAIAAKHIAARFNKEDVTILDHYIYGLVGDGDLMEGISYEAASLAGHFQLDNLILFYDDNRITIDGTTDITFTEDREKRFEAQGWRVLHVEDGNDVEALDKALQEAKANKGKPTIIIARTHIGFGSPNKQDSSKVHGAPLGEEELKLTKKNLGWPEDAKFLIPEDVAAQFRTAVEKGKTLEAQWQETWKRYQELYPEDAQELDKLMSGKLPEGWEKALPVAATDPKGEATRKSSHKCIQALSRVLPNLIGGSADLAESNLTTIPDSGLFQAGDYAKRNIPFGVREHSMAAITNGIALYGGLIPFCASFLVFTDYARPSIRLAAMMKLQCIYVFTHDGIGVGEDGPTHQPIEHYMALRAIPNLWFIRPADANEASMAWKAALKRKDGPTLLALSRQNLPVIDRSVYGSAEGLLKGGYILADTGAGLPEIILIATGSEVQYAVSVFEELKKNGISTRVVSLPCWELFEAQSKEYKDTVLPPQVKKRISIETGVTLGWERYVGDEGISIGIDHFGASAPGPVLAEKFGFTKENILQKALSLLGK
jgi:transketolase